MSPMAGVGVPAAVEAEGAKAWPGVVQCAVRDVLSDVCRWRCGRTVAGDSGSLPGGGIADAGLGVLRELASAPPTVPRAHSSVRQSRSPAARDRVVASCVTRPAERARRVQRSRERSACGSDSLASGPCPPVRGGASRVPCPVWPAAPNANRRYPIPPNSAEPGV